MTQRTHRFGQFLGDSTFAPAAGTDRVRKLVDGGDLSFFFSDGDRTFGGDESSRIAYAQIAVGDDDAPDGFIGVDLFKIGEGDAERDATASFAPVDVRKLKVITASEAIRRVSKSAGRSKA